MSHPNLSSAAIRGEFMVIDPDSAFDPTEDSLEAISDKVDTSTADVSAIKVKTDNLPSDPADQSAVEAAISASESAIRGADSDTLKTLSDQIDGIVIAGVEDAVWDALVADHTTADTFGEFVQSITGGGSANPRITGEYVADGNISKGDFVGITPEGKVKTFTPAEYFGTAFPALIEIMDGITFSYGWMSIVKEDSSSVKIAITYANQDVSTQNIMLLVGTYTFATKSWTWGTPEDTGLDFQWGYTPKNCRVADNKIAVGYKDWSGAPYAAKLCIITLDGNQIDTVGTPVAMSTGSGRICMPCSPSDGVLVVLYSEDSEWNLYAKAATVSGTVPSFGSSVMVLDDSAEFAHDSNLVALDSSTIGFAIGNSANTWWVYLATLSGTTLSLGSSDNQTARGGGILKLKDGKIAVVTNYLTSTYTKIYSYSGNTLSGEVSAPNLAASMGPSTQTKVVFKDGWAGIAYSGTLYVLHLTDELTNAAEWITVTGLSVPAYILSSSSGSIFGIGITDGDLYYSPGAYYLPESQEVYYPVSSAEGISGILGVAEEAISDGGTGTICTFGIPANQTKTGMDVRKGWYYDNTVLLMLRPRDGNNGLIAFPLTGNDLKLQPEQIGDTSWQ